MPSKTEYTMRWRARNPEWRKAYNKRQRLTDAGQRVEREKRWAEAGIVGITWADYKRIEAEQRGLCAVCAGRPGAHRLHVDHNHATGVFRGLICGRCNSAIGLAGENPDRLVALADYISGDAVEVAAVYAQ